MIETPAISPEHKNFASQLITELPKVSIHEYLPTQTDDGSQVASREQLAKHIQATVRRYREDNVVYLELRVVVEDFCTDDFVLADAFATALDAVAAEGIQARLLVCARADGAAVSELTELAVQAQGDPNFAGMVFILGEDAAWNAVGSALTAACTKLRENYMPFAIDGAAGIDAVGAAVQLGALRLGRPLALVDDFSADITGIVPGKISSWVRDRGITAEMTPLWDLADESLGEAAVDELPDHPLPLLQQLGFRCTISAGQLHAGSCSDVMNSLTETFGYGLEEFFDLTAKTVTASFLSEPERQQLLETQILPRYEKLADAELRQPDGTNESEEAEEAGETGAVTEDGSAGQNAD